MQIVRYGAVGIINTAVGYAIFWIGLHFLGLSPSLANALGYALSLCLSFVLNRRFVFDAAGPVRYAGLRFAVSFCVAFAVNQGVLLALVSSGLLRAEVAQLVAMVVYTVLFYLLNKFFVFRSAPRAENSRLS